MEYPYSYISPLDSLIYESEVDSAPLDHEAAEADLALWSNAQFTFDVQPGSGILDSDKTATCTPASTFMGATDSQLNTLDPAMYEKLVNYLDYELPAQQQQRQQHQQPYVANPSLSAAPQKVLLPKITQIQSSPRDIPAPTPAPAPKKKSIKRPAPEEDVSLADDDKRRRNTAASARFRVKKKMREQAMEQSMREMTEKSEKLQNRVDELELEVKWLRGLLVEKDARRKEDTVEA